MHYVTLVEMINLLPPNQKKEINQEKKWKTVFVFLFFVFVFSFVTAFSFYYIKDIGVPLLKKEIEVIRIEKEMLPDNSEKENKVKELKEITSQLDSFYDNSIYLGSVLEEIYETLPEESYITTFRFDKDKVFLSGYASNWHSLNETEEKFKEKFSSDFSPESWTKTEDINFLISFKIR